MSETSTLTVAEAEARSRAARARLFDTLGQVQHKLNPVTLAQDAVENVANNMMRDTVETVRARPKAVAAAAGIAALLLFRKPIAHVVRKGAKHATADRTASLKAEPAPLETEGSST